MKELIKGRRRPYVKLFKYVYYMKLNSKVELRLSELDWRKWTTTKPRTGAFERDFELNFGAADLVQRETVSMSF
ncbi:hypothetical protein A4A49_14418 [Nicotiana attenuata]|uniref:Uncharacterized protein n=1 Tax=Nicotiana attenuata TaxID=49451 RepID=A0A314LAI8_NICAT|nr:hypothetical protein A4A49_14418 [Nicotiana attenuata]